MIVIKKEVPNGSFERGDKLCRVPNRSLGHHIGASNGSLDINIKI